MLHLDLFALLLEDLRDQLGEVIALGSDDFLGRDHRVADDSPAGGASVDLRRLAHLYDRLQRIEP